MKEWSVYVLRNDSGTTYTGIAIDVEARLVKHNSGAGAKFTKGRGPWCVIHIEGPLSHGDALRREIAIKIDRVFKAELRGRDAYSIVRSAAVGRHSGGP
ncbi:MAG: GIY-YIG nuclease family protein [Rhodospirillaceae bacterium]